MGRLIIKKAIFSILFLSHLWAFSQVDSSSVNVETQNDSVQDVSAVAESFSYESSAYPKNWGIGQRIVNGQSTYTIPRKKLDFYIQHRFGNLNQGKSNFYGLDESNIRLGFEYGLLNKLTLGIARSSMGKMYSGYMKWSVINQTDNNPLSVAVFSGIDMSALNPSASLDPFYPSHRLNYIHQLIVSRVFGKQRFMLQLSPTIVHRNLVDSVQVPNDLAVLAGACRLRLSKLVSITGEYNFTIHQHMRKNLNSSAGAGIEFYTSGHVFQLTVSNASALTESQYMSTDNGKIKKGEIRFGFNIVRRF